MDSSWEHRIYREDAKRRKKGIFLADDFRDIYDQYYDIYTDYLNNLLINLISYKGAPKSLSQQGLEYMLRTFGYANLTAIDAKNIFVQGIGYDNPGVNIPLGSLIGGFGVASNSDSYITKILQEKEPQVVTRLNMGEIKPPIYVTLSNKFSFYTGQQAADVNLVSRTASTLAEIKASIIANIRQQKTPFIGFTKDGNLTSKVVWQELQSGKPFIQVDSSQFDDDIRKVITTMPVQTPNLAPTLQDSWNSALSEFLSMVGINNSNIDKKERLVAREAEANDEQVSHSMRVYLNARNQQLDLLNRVLGTKIKAVMNHDAVEELNNFARTGTGGLSYDDSMDTQTPNSDD